MADLKTGQRERTVHRNAPSPNDIIRAVLKASASGPHKSREMRRLAAKLFGFPTGAIKTRYPADSNNSFNRSFDIAIDHLRKSRMIVVDDGVAKTWKIAPHLIDVVDTVEIPPVSFGSLPIKILNSEQKIGKHWPVNINRVAAELHTDSLEKLRSMVERTQKVATDPLMLGYRHLANRVLSLIKEELGRRGYSQDPDPNAPFRWPSTTALGGDGSLSIHGVPNLGPLKALGYTVGRNGDVALIRQRVLTRAYIEPLPNVDGVDEWGPSKTGSRLKKMAYSIATFARNAKRRKFADFRKAIEMWEADLKYLHDQHYVGVYDWPWPPTN